MSTPPRHRTRTTDTEKIKTTKSGFDRARLVHPLALTGQESTRELLAHAFPAFVGRQVRQAYELLRKAISEDYVLFVTMSGAMTPAGLHQSCLIPMIERGWVDVLTTTGANLYHDAHRAIGHRVREIKPDGDDHALRLAEIIRIYDLGFSNETLLDTDRLFSAILQRPEFQHTMTTTELHHRVGKQLSRITRAAKLAPTLLGTCHDRGIPVFTGAVQDGSLFLELVKLKRILDGFKCAVDVNDDVYEMTAMQAWAMKGLGKKMAVLILGGGVPKNYTLQGEPMLDQILGVPTDGFDIDVQICVDVVDNGALSSCPASEGHTWGKVSEEGLARSVYCRADVTAVLPLIVHALLADRTLKRPQRDLYGARESAVQLLDKFLADRADHLRTHTLTHPAQPAHRRRARAVSR